MLTTEENKQKQVTSLWTSFHLYVNKATADELVIIFLAVYFFEGLNYCEIHVAAVFYVTLTSKYSQTSSHYGLRN